MPNTETPPQSTMPTESDRTTGARYVNLLTNLNVSLNAERKTCICVRITSELLVSTLYITLTKNEIHYLV